MQNRWMSNTVDTTVKLSHRASTARKGYSKDLSKFGGSNAKEPNETHLKINEILMRSCRMEPFDSKMGNLSRISNRIFSIQNAPWIIRLTSGQCGFEFSIAEFVKQS